MFRKIILSIFFPVIALTTGAQDVNFSQFYELPLLRNPALAGNFTGDIKATAAFRTQWLSAAGVPYRTQALGIELKSGVSESSDVAAGRSLDRAGWRTKQYQPSTRGDLSRLLQPSQVRRLLRF